MRKPNYLGVYQCDNCSRSLKASFLPNLTLIFVVADIPCLCRRPVEPLYQLPTEDPGPDWCTYKKAFRNKPSTCYANTDKENATDCGSGASAFFIRCSTYLYFSLVSLLLLT